MKTIISILVIGILAFGMTSSSTISYPKAKVKSYTSGEKLTYRVSYGIIDAGEAVLTVKETAKRGADGRRLYHMVGEGKTRGAFNWFYKVHDVYETYMDKEGAFPWHFVRDVNEGGYTINQEYAFHQDKQKVVDQDGKEYKVPLGVKDMLSSFYFARTLDFSKMKRGQIIEFKMFMDGEIWPLKIKYLGKENINIRKGTFKALKFVPVVQEGRYFTSEEDVQFWVTDDNNHIPILVKAKIPVGTVRLHLVDWEGLRGPISKID
ncbi:MAG: DUF3108 domain-containing protein [Brumimicrobium sp.]